MRKIVRKAVIPAGGISTKFLPATKSQPKEMMPIVDTPTIQYIIEEAVSSGIEEIIIITNSTKRAIEDHFDKSYELEAILRQKEKYELLQLVQDISNMVDIHYTSQKGAKGLGHAILCAKTFVSDEPFAVLLGDDLFVTEKTPPLKQLIDAYMEVGCSVVGVQQVPDTEVDKYGIVAIDKPYYNIDKMSKLAGLIEKPEKQIAPSNLGIMGRYILTPQIFEMLEEKQKENNEEIQLTKAIDALLNRQAVFAYELEGSRYDIGDLFGYIKANLDMSLQRDELKAEVENFLKLKIKQFQNE